MALAPYTTVKFKPVGETTAGKTYSSTLQRWLAQQKEARGLYAGAEAPLQESIGMFRKGGGYGAEQMALIEDEAKQARAEALAEQVKTGMSSGSLATSTGLRSAADVTKAKLGVEDVRTQFLSQALSQLAGLRGTQAGQVGTAVDPTYNAFMSYLSNLGGQQEAALSRVGQMNLARQSTQQPKEEKSPWASMVW